MCLLGSCLRTSVPKVGSPAPRSSAALVRPGLLALATKTTGGRLEPGAVIRPRPAALWRRLSGIAGCVQTRPLRWPAEARPPSTPACTAEEPNILPAASHIFYHARVRHVN